MPKIELLAPAKNTTSGQMAINAGADAVYIGAARFGARQSVGNSLKDIEILTRYAHKYWARVYATVNTLLFDHEIDEALQLIDQLYQMGVDALIVQDTGLLEANLPPIALFASTQMHNHTPDRVAFLEQIGIQRVILARELSLEQIAAIRAATTVELESFVHGALCVAYSGQCTLSYAIGGRSGNRGACAQPCRRVYSLVDQNNQIVISNQHLLSLKDLNLTPYLRGLLDAGVSSFKIEGRLKDEAYVKNIVGHYRRQLDQILPDYDFQPASSGQVDLGFEPDPHKTFNRGYTTYFVSGQRDDIFSPETPKHAGEPLGVVTAVQKNAFRLNIAPQLNNGDGLTFFDSAGQLCGTFVNRVVGDLVYPAKMEGIRVGMQIRRNQDRAFLNIVEKAQPQRKIPVKLVFSEIEAGFQLTGQDQDANFGVARLTTEKLPAQKPEKARHTLEKQLQKLGNSEFVCAALELDLAQAYFLSVALINELRRALVADLQRQRQKNLPRLLGGIRPSAVPHPETSLDFLGNVLNQQAEAFYRRHGVEQIEPAAEAGIRLSGRKVMTTKHCLRYEIGACHLQKEPIPVDEPLFLQDENGLRLRLKFNCRACVMEIYFEA